MGATLGSVLGLLIISSALGLVYFRRYRKKKRRDSETPYSYELGTSNHDSIIIPSSRNSIMIYPQSIDDLKNAVIASDDSIILKKVIGSGNFGTHG